MIHDSYTGAGGVNIIEGGIGANITFSSPAGKINNVLHDSANKVMIDLQFLPPLPPCIGLLEGLFFLLEDGPPDE